MNQGSQWEELRDLRKWTYKEYYENPAHWCTCRELTKLASEIRRLIVYTSVTSVILCMKRYRCLIEIDSHRIKDMHDNEQFMN